MRTAPQINAGISNLSSSGGRTTADIIAEAAAARQKAADNPTTAGVRYKEEWQLQHAQHLARLVSCTCSAQSCRGWSVQRTVAVIHIRPACSDYRRDVHCTAVKPKRQV